MGSSLSGSDSSTSNRVVVAPVRHTREVARRPAEGLDKSGRNRGMNRATPNLGRQRSQVPTNNHGDSTRNPTRRTNHHDDANRIRRDDPPSAAPRRGIHHPEAGQNELEMGLFDIFGSGSAERMCNRSDGSKRHGMAGPMEAL